LSTCSNVSSNSIINNIYIEHFHKLMKMCLCIKTNDLFYDIVPPDDTLSHVDVPI
jgi:hypothetical protein